MREGLVVNDADGVIIASNAAAQEILDVTREQMHGLTPMDPHWKFVREDGSDVLGHENPAMVALATGKPQIDVVLGVNRPSGEIRWIICNSVPVFLPEAARPHQVTSTFRDITEERLHASELASALTKAERAAKSKQQFLANMSHEIRTPLNGIIGLAQVLEGTDLADEQREFVTTILESGANLMTVLNDVLDLSKIEAGKFDIVRTDGVLDELLRRQLKVWKPYADEKGLGISLALDADLPQRLSFDAVRVQQCLSNLLSNAVKFTTRGCIEIFATSVEQSDGDHIVEIRVKDTGLGMDKATLTRLFQPFAQADETTSRSHGGTGLGLSITRRLTELMGGTAWARSEVGRGSVFHISFRGSPVQTKTIPQDQPGLLAGSDEVRDQLKSSYLRVLVVDDNTINRQVVMLFLKPLNAHIVEATNGVEALAAMEDERFDLVLLDMHMPVLDGPGTIERIRDSNEDWAMTPVIALTADAMSGDRERYMDMGLDGYIPKPLSVRDLLSEIARVLGTAERFEMAEAS